MSILFDFLRFFISFIVCAVSLILSQKILMVIFILIFNFIFNVSLSENIGIRNDLDGASNIIGFIIAIYIAKKTYKYLERYKIYIKN